MDTIQYVSMEEEKRGANNVEEVQYVRTRENVMHVKIVGEAQSVSTGD